VFLEFFLLTRVKAKIIYILIEEIAHHIHVPLMTKSSITVNQETKQTPKIAMPRMAFMCQDFSPRVRKKVIMDKPMYPIRPNAGTGMPNGYETGLLRTASHPPPLKQKIEDCRRKLWRTYTAMITPRMERTNMMRLRTFPFSLIYFLSGFGQKTVLSQVSLTENPCLGTQGNAFSQGAGE